MSERVEEARREVLDARDAAMRHFSLENVNRLNKAWDELDAAIRADERAKLAADGIAGQLARDEEFSGKGLYNLARAYLAQVGGMRRLNEEIDAVGNERYALRAENEWLKKERNAAYKLVDGYVEALSHMRAQLDAALSAQGAPDGE